MSRTIISLTVITVLSAEGAIRAEHAGHHHDVGHHHHGFENNDVGHTSGVHHVGMSHDHHGGYGYCWGGLPLGMPALVQPAFNPGLVWLQTAQAAVQWEQVQKLNIQNMALMDQQGRQRNQTRIQFLSARHNAELQRRLARQEQRNSAPRERLSDQRTAALVMSADGTIAWPVLLCDDQYKAQRNQLEVLLARRVAKSFEGLERDDLRQVDLSCKDLLAVLTRHARDANSNDWIEAKRFVDRISFDARQADIQGRMACH